MTTQQTLNIDELIQHFEELTHQLSLENTDIELLAQLEEQRLVNIRQFFNHPLSKLNLIPTEKFTRLLELDKLIISLAVSHKDEFADELKQFKKNNKAANAYKNL